MKDNGYCLLYNHTAGYAEKNGEMDLYRKSYSANFQCAKFIKEMISENFDGSSLDCEKILENTIDEFGLDRTRFIVANTINQNEWDGRISIYNKKWAEKIKTVPEEDITGSKADFTVAVNVHPGLMNLIASKFQQMERRMNDPGIER